MATTPLLAGHTPGTINQSKHGLILPIHNVTRIEDTQQNFAEIEAHLGRLPFAKSYYTALAADQAAIGVGTTAVPGLNTVFYTYDVNTEVIVMADIQFFTSLGLARPTDLYTWWNHAWGLQAYNVDSTQRNSGVSGANATVFPTISWTAVANRYVRAHWHSAYVTPAAASQCIVQWTDNAGTVMQNAVVDNVNGNYHHQSAYFIGAFAAGAQTLKIMASSNTVNPWIYQTGTYGAYLSVEDIGPSAAIAANVDPYMALALDGVNQAGSIQYSNPVYGGNFRYSMVDRWIVPKPGPHTISASFVNGSPFGDTFTIQGPPSHITALALS